ncbi:hypothetical protein PRK78_006567 [Emydomyces testavorans]|uniref:Uncharacterized protein n=1 Tax=Emydomyces testavorans TaxID=2070801 RepID=A0AAF0IKY1_9EURO|nr:hypothetical protein PRK78_006567 [Emydomyces testavorans]
MATTAQKVKARVEHLKSTGLVLTIHQIQLHLCLIILNSDYPVIHKLQKKEIDAVSWQQSKWKERCSQINNLSDADYKGLAHTLEDYGQFKGTELTGDKIKNQAMALMAEVRMMAGGKTTPIPSKSDEFSVAANIMILCACVGIFAISPLLENNIYQQTDFKTHAVDLSQSPLYRGKEVTTETIAIELRHIIQFLQPESSFIKTKGFPQPVYQQ